MNTINFSAAYKASHPSAITIGTFDGVHLGHKKIIEQLTAEANGLDTTILTFFPHPRMVLQQDTNIKLINTIDERIALLGKTALDNLIIYPFTKEFSRLRALDFVRDILVDKLHAKKVVIGYDHRFGRNRNANIDDLKAFGGVFKFDVEEITAKEINNITISSTKIRKALNDGNIAKANAYLGYEFMLTGVVTKGKGLGRQLNFPTANIHIKETYKLIPKKGAYIVKSTIDGQCIYGMMNIGNNPTVSGTDLTIEVHFFDYKNDLYGKEVQVQLLKRIRDEQKFTDIEALKEQLKKDETNAKAFVKEYHAK